jgi:hypothetical protein
MNDSADLSYAVGRLSWSQSVAHVGVAALVLASLLAACDASGVAVGGRTVADSAGIRIVVSERPAWGAGPAHLDSTPVVQIGSDEPGPYLFSFIGAGLLLADGRIGVTEMTTNEVRLFSKEGKHLGSIGRRGRGPGEYQLLSGVFPLGDDSLITYDQMLRRTMLLSPTGGVPRVVANPLPGNLSAFGVLEGEKLLLYNPGSVRRGAPPGLQWDTTDVARFDLTNGTGRVIARLPSRQRFYEQDGNARSLSPAHLAVFAASSDGFYWAETDRNEIRFFDGEGNLERILRRPVEPRSVEPAMIERWIAVNLDDARRREGEAAVPRYRTSLEAGLHGDRVPLFQQAFVDHDERLWLGESAWPEVQMASRRWSIFGVDGVWLGDLEVPSGFRVLDCRGNLVLGVLPDENDVPRVRVHLMVQP